jgi:hypothetical protein
MRRLAFGFFVILCVGAAAFAASTMGPWAPVVEPEPPGLDATGGPDAYGYTWIDSNEPGGPVYTWKDISTIGTLVTGLTDDNWVGPFSVGFPFHFYWYDITQYWLGANGFLKFGTPGPMSSTFPASIPLAAVPNDFAAVYAADWLIQGTSGQVYRWNNADSLVVSWINVPAWDPNPPGYTGSHTFQVILSRLDSSLTYQYGSQTGTTQANDILVGIENSNGLVGLERAHDVYMTANYAVYWNSPSTTSYIAHDMAATASGNANSEGFFVTNGNAVTPYGKVKNIGNQTESSFTINCTIRQNTLTGPIVYNQTVTQGPLAPGAELPINFSPNWTPAVNAQYIMITTVNLTGDMNPANNIKNCEVHVLIVPGTLLFDDNVAEYGTRWQGNDGGFAQHFVPPSYPVVVDSIRYFISSTAAGSYPFIARVLDDDGPNGLPGTILFSQNIATPAAGWYGTVANVTINNGAFYVAWLMTDDSTAYLGMDSTGQLGSRQCYEYTGGWTISRDGETVDAMIHARITSPGTIPNVTVTLLPVNPPIIIPPTGGSFDWDITMHNGETTPQTLDVWTIITLPGGSTRPGWGPYLNLNMVAGQTINRIRTQNISDRYPPGAYTYTANIGDHPSVIWDSDSFPFTKAAAGDDGWARNESSVGLTPAEYALRGAIPNPFNPTTTLSFALPQAGSVKLSVYNVTGREVATLVNGWRDAGNHEVTFDATGLASGLYVYQLTAGDFHATSKMMLMK